MKRDKIISLRVNSDLLNKVQNIIDEHTEIKSYIHRTYYTFNLSIEDGFVSYNKYSFADLIERLLKDFVNKYEIK